MKMAQYWESQEQRWHEKYLEAEQMIDQLESKVWNQASRIDTLEGALRKIVEINNKRDRFSNEIDQIAIEVLGDANV
jgi:predicted RNase H-like nuclease (RuvC/YqgF family)